MGRPATHHADRRRELVAIAEQLFVEKGYRETTIPDLITATGLSRGGFYHYFTSKEEVLAAAIDGVLDEAEQVISGAAAMHPEPALAIGAIIRGMNLLRERHGEFASFLAMIVGEEAPAVTFYRRVVERLAPPLAVVVARFPVVEPQVTAELLLNTITAATRSPHRDVYLLDPERRARYARAIRESIARTVGLEADDPALANLTD